MRIWLANHYAVPPNLGGITRHYELAREWVDEEGAEVTLWLSSFNHSRRRFIDQETKRELDRVPGLHLRWLWSFPHTRNDFRRVLNMLSFAFLFFLSGLFRSRPDVLFASSPHLLTPFAGWLLSRIKRCPFVLEVRDLWPDTLVKMDGLKNPRVIKALTWLESFLYRKADKIVVLTEYQRKFIVAKGIEPEKVSLIPNGIVVGSWKPDPRKKSEYRRRMGVAPYQFVALYAGAHGPANALEYVVRAGEHLPDGYAIVLIGDGPEKERLREIKARRSLHNVHLLDPVPKGEVYHFIHAADCGVISLADNEIFRGARPNKLFDYMFVGKPIITTVDGEVRDIVEENGVGLFSGAEDPRGLAEAMKKLRHMTEEERRRVTERGRDYIERFGDRRKLAHLLYGELKSLVRTGWKAMKEAKRSG
ncbi:glycosyltransferase involved in cell wall biosynthesis [Melghirimyces profundicolus]|uniref:Glycosyltransferase involved in cell wall biosynthesis n=1 Tax=Melghirimyces profundicolus TaxID=1242148 RepID=A0A2T6C2J6_9BACL|nr:glycosyltransferase family 4 protein [Melghirimyces profundicolus]PTX62552.1 glycosyltransferase involved in cell wall biosynthesis [Melghirimyces profundicolus]